MSVPSSITLRLERGPLIGASGFAERIVISRRADEPWEDFTGRPGEHERGVAAQRRGLRIHLDQRGARAERFERQGSRRFDERRGADREEEIAAARRLAGKTQAFGRKPLAEPDDIRPRVRTAGRARRRRSGTHRALLEDASLARASGAKDVAVQLD